MILFYCTTDCTQHLLDLFILFYAAAAGDGESEKVKGRAQLS